jgi:hypothetical protein
VSRKLLIDRINEKIERQGDCLIWTGAVDQRGSAKIAVEKNSNGFTIARNVLRYLWRQERGSYPSRLYNTCGNNRCLNLKHYRLPINSKFITISNEQVLEIRELWRLSQLHKTTMEKLAKKYGTTKQNIEYIVNNRVRTNPAQAIREKADSFQIERSYT